MSNKPTAFEGLAYPYEKLNDRQFEELLYHVFCRDIENGIYQGRYDKIQLMQGVGERGRDSILYLRSDTVGVIQCKKHSARLTKPDAAREIIKFVLNYLIDRSLITDPTKFTYYLAASENFAEPAVDLLNDFNRRITCEHHIETWTKRVISDHTSLQAFRFDDIKDELFGVLRSITVEKVTANDLDWKLELCPGLKRMFFEVQKLTIMLSRSFLTNGE